MKPFRSSPPGTPADAEVGARVADDLAEAASRGPGAALGFARTCTEPELRLGLGFVTTVLEIASISARAMSLALEELARGKQPPTRWN